MLAYSGIFLTAASHKKLLAVAPAQHPHVHADHATLDYRPTPEQVCWHALSFLCLRRSCSWISNAGTAAAVCAVSGVLATSGSGYLWFRTYISRFGNERTHAF